MADGVWLRAEPHLPSTINHTPSTNRIKCQNVALHSIGGHQLFSFEKLEVWQEAITFANTVYRISRSFPSEERFGLTNQMRRAAVSVSSNIAEGSARISRKDFARFIEIATGSVYEVVSESTIARNQGFQSEAEYLAIYKAADKLGRMLSGLRNSIKI